MSKAISSERRNFEEQLLVGELTHRMNNEFAAAIAVVSLAAARSPNGEVKSALAGVEARCESAPNMTLHLRDQSIILDADRRSNRMLNNTRTS